MYLKVREIGERPDCRVNWWIWEVLRVHWQEHLEASRIGQNPETDKHYNMPDEEGRYNVTIVAQLAMGQDIIINLGTDGYVLGKEGQTIDRIPN